MDKFGLIGHPIRSSGSPALFKAAYAGKYPYELIEGADFEVSWKRFLSEYRAINVTAPFKEIAFQRVMKLAVEGRADIAGPVMKTGATNLVVKRSDGTLEAHNSDFTGIILSIADALFPGIVREFYGSFGDKAHIKIHQYVRQGVGLLYDKTPQALVVGCGGAGKAAAVAAAELGFETSIMNRSMEKARGLAEKLPEYNFISVPISDFKAAFKECELVIYTLPLKLEIVDDLCEEDFAGEDRYESSSPGKVLLEANYKNPSFNGEILEKASKAGCQYIHGKRWLLWQAVSGYSLMTGEQPDVTAMEQV